jgi:hypothetical protein
MSNAVVKLWQGALLWSLLKCSVGPVPASWPLAAVAQMGLLENNAILQFAFCASLSRSKITGMLMWLDCGLLGLGQT